jgi:biopolymer transport protein ExbD
VFLKNKLQLLDVGASSDDVYLNLTPMIDILTCLLFFLLLSFGAIVVALINASIPALSEGADPGEPDKTIKVTMSISVTDKGFDVSGSADGLGEEASKKLVKKIPLGAEGYDYQALNDFMFEVKKSYKESDSVVIVPNPDIPYDVLVRVMDASRERDLSGEGKLVRLPLFPAAVVSSLVK